MPYRRFLRVLMALGERATAEAQPSAPVHSGAQDWSQRELDALKARHANRLRESGS